MNTQDYLAQKKSTDLHFWYQARKALIRNLLASKFDGFSQNRQILDIGCGTGGEIDILKQYGQVSVLDIDNAALEVIQEHDCTVMNGDIEKIEIKADNYDGICCFDILEHLKKDREVLKKIHRALRPGGHIFISVPAYPLLYSTHDKYSGHIRRYTRKDLQDKLRQAGFANIDLNYWNFFLFFPIACFRLAKKIVFFYLLKNRELSTDAKPLKPFLNNFLFHVLNSENLAIKNNIRLPFGLTIFGSAKK